ncbi:hypothetical protein BD309DRAFT_988821 [Dichomitus squalens]|uniref:RING-type domain-containing protein n=1 Tax=Dichomitus squalens TaxID=114155 RepID=A0A4Q9P1B9_9APHY|nr:uncharacterized protein DICSQDRAFT_152253 [Dichomitus squalens LYAD-421 SS1]EJF66286.1 hypothetical protein DICSQDRAFT_152253 [Dichomitus squalens LYAD-421 SS1]TBU46452.1 hypothetical protein BD309DRAFT_988821 [Dichomitus squalens]TBU65307.1 hypothetical protein BD310DRAFT_2409 [Dichomitus squalens]
MATIICRVCLEALQDKTVVSTQCGHLFCSECAGSVFSYIPTPCPICRKPQSSHSLIRLFPEWETPSETVTNTVLGQPAARNVSSPLETPHVVSRLDSDSSTSSTAFQPMSTASRPRRRGLMEDVSGTVDPEAPISTAFRPRRGVPIQLPTARRSVSHTTRSPPSPSDLRRTARGLNAVYVARGPQVTPPVAVVAVQRAPPVTLRSRSMAIAFALDLDISLSRTPRAR